MIEHKFEHDIIKFIKNKKANVRKLVEASNERKSSHVFDQDYMYVVNKRTCTITAWYMGVEQNFVVWQIGYSPNWLYN